MPVFIDGVEVLRLEASQKILGISKDTLFRWLRTGKLHRIKWGGNVFISKEEIDKIIKERGKK